MRTPFLLWAGALACSAVLVACGGNSGSSSTPTASAAPAASMTSGVLSAFGSLIVNGHEYATNDGTLVVDGDAGDAASNLSALQVGMTVDVDSDANATNPTALRVRFASAVRGGVDAIDSTNSRITVLGQTVLVTSATSFAGSKALAGTTTAVNQLSSLRVGDYVVVYGYVQCTNPGTGCNPTDVVATLVLEPPTTGGYRAQGYVEGLNGAATRFSINGLAVTVVASGSSATVCAPAPCALSNGSFVAVRSSTTPTMAGGALTLAAGRIEAATQIPVLNAGSSVSIEGPVSQLNTVSNTFAVRDVSVDATALASIVTELSSGDVAQVTGTVTASGSLSATAITIERHADFTILAPLDSTSGTADTLSVLGQTFTVNSSTRFVDWARGVRPFNQSNFATVLSPGDQLIVSGYALPCNVATRVERIPKPATPTVGVEGIATADSDAADTVSVGAVTITVDSSTWLEYAAAGASPSPAGFFSAITLNSTVVAALGAPGTGTGTIAAVAAAALPTTNPWVTGPH